MTCRILLLALALTACGTASPERQANETDPAITEALNDPIMADPRLELQRGGGSIAVPVGPEAVTQTQTLSQLAAARVREPAFAGCDARIGYAFAWMARLPAALALPRGATVSEAAGSDAKGCQLRIVRFVIGRPPADIEAFYRKKGFTVYASEGSVGGVRKADGAAYWVSFRPIPNGTAVDFVTNRGR